MKTLLRAARLPQLLRLIRFAAGRLLRRVREAKTHDTRFFTAKVVFDIRSERLFKRYLFTIVRCLSLQGVRTDFCLRIRFLLRDVEPGDLDFCIRHSFRFVSSVLIKLRTSYKFRVEEGLPDLQHDVTDRRLRYIDLASGGQSDNNKEFLIPLTLGPTLIHSHLEWIPTTRELAGASFEARSINIFFSGALQKPAYQNCQMLNDDGILGRVQIADFLKLCPLVSGVEYVTDFAISHAMLTDTIRHHVVIVEAQTAGFSGLEYRNILLRARFFLALPGIASIFTHSLVEALSCGLVPIMQKSTHLPAVFVDGRNCLLFSDLNHLCEVIRKAHIIDERVWNELSANALMVYRDVFSPEAIGRDIWQALQQGKTLKIIQA